MTDPTKPDLLPCPFCGGPAAMQTWTTNYAVVCRAVPYCAEARPAKSPEDAAAIWNRRAPPAAPTGWRMVPEKLTEDMAAEMECQFSTEAQWEAALAAAPSPTTGPSAPAAEVTKADK